MTRAPAPRPPHPFERLSADQVDVFICMTRCAVAPDRFRDVVLVDALELLRNQAATSRR